MSAPALGIAGLGLIGGSIARDACAAGYAVIGYDRDAAALDRAEAAGAIGARAAGLATLAARCDVLVIALPVDATIAALSELANAGAPPVVFDVASVKAPVMRAAQHVRGFVGTHPIAGREIGGFDASQAGLFAGRPWAIVPSADAAAQASVTAFVRQLGATPVAIGAAEHDRIVSTTSHLPQSVSVALATLFARRLAADPALAALCGTGASSMLRLASSPPAVWEPIFAANAPAVAADLRALAGLLIEAASGLENGTSEPLLSYFSAGAPALAAMERSDRADRSLSQSIDSR